MIPTTTNTTTNTTENSAQEVKTRHKGRRAPILINDMSPFMIKEAYKAARANINFALTGRGGSKRFIVTSSTVGEGKTTTSLNLAIVFAQTKAKVLLIDADMRKASVHKYLGIKNVSGLSNVLSGFVNLNEVIKKTTHGFDCMTAGPIPPNPAELLLSEATSELLDTLSEYYDFIIIDTPPVAVVSDALALVDKVDGTVIAIRERHANHDDLKKTVSALRFAEAKILGFILNDASGEDGTYKYNYKYRYRKTYKYYDYDYSYGE